MKIKLLIFSINLLSFPLLAQTTFTSGPGSWSDASKWNNGVPSNSSEATVNHELTLDTDLDISKNANFIINSKVTDLSGGSAYDIDLHGSSPGGIIDINANLTIEGNFDIRNDGQITIRSYDTVYVGGYFSMRNNSTLSMEEGAVLIIQGDMELRNSSISTINGQISVQGNLTTRNTSIITGSGNIQTLGEIDIRNSSSVFGVSSDCSPGPCEYGSGVGLPIELIYFRGVETEMGTLRLEWETLTEVNNDYFQIEWSYEGDKFEVIHQTSGAGNSNFPIQYHWNIEDPELQGGYFKLKQVDFDGKFSYSKTILLTNSTETNHMRFKLYPNPLEGEILKVDFENFEVAEYLAEIVDLKGQIIRRRLLRVSDKVESYTLEVTKLVLPKGIYFVRIQGDNFYQTKRLIIN